MLRNCRASAAVSVDHTVGQGVGFRAIEDVDVQDVFTKEGFAADLRDDQLSFLIDRDQIAEAGAFADGFVFLHPNAGKALLAVDEESLVGDDYLVCDHFFKGRELGLTLSAIAIFFNQLLEPANGVFGELF